MELEKGVLVVLTKTIQESVGTSAYKNDCFRCSHPLFGGVGNPRGKIPLWCVDTFGRLTSLQDVIVIFAPQKREGWLRVRHCWGGVPCFQPAYFASWCKGEGKWNKAENSFDGHFTVGWKFLSFGAIPFPYMVKCCFHHKCQWMWCYLNFITLS